MSTDSKIPLLWSEQGLPVSNHFISHRLSHVLTITPGDLWKSECYPCFTVRKMALAD